jgi:hypothetical protein
MSFALLIVDKVFVYDSDMIESANQPASRLPMLDKMLSRHHADATIEPTPTSCFLSLLFISRSRCLSLILSY